MTIMKKEKKEKIGIVKSLKLLWTFMDTKDRVAFVCIFAFSWISALAWMFFNLVPPLVLASLTGEPVKLLFIDMSALSTLAVTAILLGTNFVLWVFGMLHYYLIDIFARKMICVVNIKAQDLILEKRKNLDFGMTLGEVNYIVQNATECVYQLIEPICWSIFTNMLAVLMNVAVLFTIDWVIGITGILMICGIFLIVYIRLKIQNPVVEKIEATGAKVGNQMLTSAQNLPLITMLKSKLEEKKQLGYLNKTFYKHHKKRAKIGFWYWNAINGLEFLAIGVAVWLFIARNGTAEAVTSITMIFTILASIQNTIEGWGWKLGDIQAASVKLCNLEKINPTKSAINEARLHKNLSLYDENIQKIELLDMNVSLGKFKKSYHGTFESGKLYLLSGQSGCGKTTFINALCGLREVKYGQILINDRYALDSLEDFTDKISYMFQNSILFDRSIEKNISYPNALLNAESKRLIKKFGMQKLINREEEGKDVRSTLSGGEKKRIDFIRAISRKADIYLFDEPTNELDERNVKKVIEELDRLKKTGKITIIISHDNRIAEIADEIIEI